MPDPTRATISATEASALFDASPWVTLWMLYQRFAHGNEGTVVENARMDWGKKLEPLVLAQAAEDLKFEVRPNRGEDGKQVYVRNGLFGCTRDADIFCPTRGPGTCETKCVFDYRTWMAEWKGGNSIPKQNEIQVQVQMKVGAEGKPFTWGVFAVWVAGEVFYYERKPVQKFWDALDVEADRFFAAVKAGNEPDPFGAAVEYPLLRECFPTDAEKVLDLREGVVGERAAENLRMFDYHRSQRLSHEKGEESIKARFAGQFRDAGKVLLPHGMNMTLKTNKSGLGIKHYIPADLEQGSIKPFEEAELGG